MGLTEKINAFWRRQKWVIPFCFAMSLLFTFLTIIFFCIRGFDGMENTFTFTLGADIVSLCVCTVLLFSFMYDRRGFSEHTRTFVLLISATSAVLFSDACCWIVQGIRNLRIWNIIANLFNYTGAILLLYFLWRYISTALEVQGKYGRFVNILMNILLIPTLISCLINIWIPLYFTVDDMGFYHREPLYMLSQSYLGVGLIVIVIGFFLSKKNVKEKLIIASFILIPVGNQLITGYSFGLTSGFSAMLISIVLVFGVVVARREKAMIATEKELYEAKVQVMVSQIRPHFMYNALSSIAILCKLQPDTAYTATVTFADYLRSNMDSLKQTTPVPFTKELEHLKKYLYIEKLRFQDKLDIKYDIHTTAFYIPLLSVQPLVENAVKHGVGMKENGGTVTIATRETDDAFEVSVIDDGVGFDPDQKKDADDRSHIGMENTKKRLHDMCDASIFINSTPGTGTTVRIVLPKTGQEKGATA